jgi:hypothetical protein
MQSINAAHRRWQLRRLARMHPPRPESCQPEQLQRQRVQPCARVGQIVKHGKVV